MGIHIPAIFDYAERELIFRGGKRGQDGQGLIDEADTERALRYMYDGNLRTQLSVGDDIWQGTIDFFVDPDTIIEHKATNAANFLRKGRLPYDFHCLQVLAYRHFVQLERPDRMIYARLYYRTHAHRWPLHLRQVNQAGRVSIVPVLLALLAGAASRIISDTSAWLSDR